MGMEDLTKGVDSGSYTIEEIVNVFITKCLEEAFPRDLLADVCF